MNVTEELVEYRQFRTTDTICVRQTIKACLEIMDVDDVVTLPDLQSNYNSITTALVWIRELNPTKGWTMKNANGDFKVWRWK